MANPKQTAEQFFPGLGAQGQFVVGATNLGYSVTDATITLNTARTPAQLIASPPNTGTNVFCAGPVVHSIGAVPSIVLVQPLWGNSMGPFTVTLVTADSSAVYLDARSHTLGADNARVRVTAIR